MVAEYFFVAGLLVAAESSAIGGGAENCFGAEEDVTGAPCAAGEALLDGAADGFGRGLRPLLI
jgi:hypothetical protein